MGVTGVGGEIAAFEALLHRLIQITQPVPCERFRIGCLHLKHTRALCLRFRRRCGRRLLERGEIARDVLGRSLFHINTGIVA